VATTATRATGTKVTSAGQRRTPKAAKTSSVAKKVVMAVTGIIMIAYLIAHMIGNLHAFQCPKEYNDYALFLRTFGEPLLPYRTLLTAIEIVLSLSVIGHIWAAVSLWRQAKRARPVGYVTKKANAQTYASRTMRWGGVIILLFLIYHLLDFTAGAVNPGFVEGDVYRNVVASFSLWYVSLFYILAQVALGFHLYHGLWSLFQSLGWNQPRFNRWRSYFAHAFAWIITIGNISFPLAVLTGLVR
jgi:succinate dehydrogenase / fumarate reductase cytochrome b subunit